MFTKWDITLLISSSISRAVEYIEKYQKIFTTLRCKLLASLMLKIGCTTPENDLICFILVMGIPTQPITEQLE
jgi:hypothetical protein